MTSEGDSESIRFMRGMCPQTHAHIKKNAHENCEKPAILKAIMRFATETRLAAPPPMITVVRQRWRTSSLSLRSANSQADSNRSLHVGYMPGLKLMTFMYEGQAAPR